MYTRKDYMDDPCHQIGGRGSMQEGREERTNVFRRYYAQLVNEATRQHVRRVFGMERLLESNDPHFNDIPLAEWDAAAQQGMPLAMSFRELGDYSTLGGLVCVAKEAARQLIE